jgi:Leu/Phe-tRNA-protein transferase
MRYARLARSGLAVAIGVAQVSAQVGAQCGQYGLILGQAFVAFAPLGFQTRPSGLRRAPYLDPAASLHADRAGN